MGRGFESRRWLKPKNFSYYLYPKSDMNTDDPNTKTDQISTTNENLESSSEKAQNIPMLKSHLRRKLIYQSKKNFIITGIGLLLIVILLVTYGQILLINFSVLIGRSKQEVITTTGNEENIYYLPPPVLDPLLNATNSAVIQVSGTLPSDKNVQIKLYLNDELTDVVNINKDQSFIFKDVELKDGLNELKATAAYNDKVSVYSEALILSYLKKSPELSIEYPQDGTTFTGGTDTLAIKGKTSLDVQVTINDYIAVMKNDGSFSYDFKLQNGENRIKIIAKDPAGNITEKELIINYAQ